MLMSRHSFVSLSIANDPCSVLVLVNTLWRERKIDEAVLAVQDMENRGIVGTASLYYDLARCLCSAGRCDEALLQVCFKKLNPQLSSICIHHLWGSIRMIFSLYIFHYLQRL